MEGGDVALWNPIGSLNVFKFWVMVASPCMDSGSTSILRGDFKAMHNVWFSVGVGPKSLGKVRQRSSSTPAVNFNGYGNSVCDKC